MGLLEGKTCFVNADACASTTACVCRLQIRTGKGLCEFDALEQYKRGLSYCPIETVAVLLID